MYKIVNAENNNVIGYTDNVRYIKKINNGCFSGCSEKEATGISVNGNPYQLLGKNLENTIGTAYLVSIDGGSLIKSLTDSLKSVIISTLEG